MLGFSSLLTMGNPKIAKSNASNKGYLSCLQHLAPSTVSGYNVCPQASPGCIAACLNTAGRGVYKPIQNVRIARTRYFIENRDKYLILLKDEIEKFIRKCKKLKLKPAIRLNGTSDIPWEKMCPELFAQYREVQFYDYTKVTNRMLRWCKGKLPKNYHLTFSRSENNGKACYEVLKAGGNVAVVFHPIPLPKKFTVGNEMLAPLTIGVIDGDKTDQRFLDAHNVIVGLKAKGRARRDMSGFVIHTGKV